MRVGGWGRKRPGRRETCRRRARRVGAWLAALTAALADVTVHVSTPADEHVTNGRCSLVEAIQYADGQLAPDCGTSAPSGIVTIDVPAGCYQIFGGAYIVMLASCP